MNLKEIRFEKGIILNRNDALIIVDLQNDFIPGGALPVEEGDLIIEDINSIAKKFSNMKSHIALTQDWHPKGHMSFASSHPGMNPGDEYQSDSIGPILWPDHCVQGSKGADFHKSLNVDLAHTIIRKGYNQNIDSYSGFVENDKKSETGLSGYLRSLKIKRIFICGLALDYCCYFTAMDGVDFGFEVFFLAGMTKGIDAPPGNINISLSNMEKKGIKFVNLESFTD
jgi:nicotinamidase/pyrazinamidase